MKRTRAQISFNMSRIRSKGSEIEKIMASALRKRKIKFRRHVEIMGRPDFVLVPHKVAIFCDSAFWHGYKEMRTSRHRFQSNKVFWTKKIKGNVERDREVNTVLKEAGWNIFRFWDFQIKRDADKCISKIANTIRIRKLSR